jgi:hypothetical protein
MNASTLLIGVRVMTMMVEPPERAILSDHGFVTRPKRSILLR